MKKNYGELMASWFRRRWAKLKVPLVWVISLGGFAMVVYQVCFASDAETILSRAWAFLIVTGGGAVVAISLTIISMIVNEQGKKKG